MTGIEQRYLAYFDEINRFVQEIDVDTTTVDRAQKRVRDILEDAYLLGYFDCGYELRDPPGRVADESKMSKLLTVKYEGLDTDDRVAECVIDRDESRLHKILDTEWHRMYNGGGHDRAEEVEEDEDVQIWKTWNTMRDPRVRETHRPLEGIRIPLNRLFYTWDGDSAPYPGAFRLAENNVNCRCRVVYKRQGSL